MSSICLAADSMLVVLGGYVVRVNMFVGAETWSRSWSPSEIWGLQQLYSHQILRGRGILGGQCYTTRLGR